MKMFPISFTLFFNSCNLLSSRQPPYKVITSLLLASGHSSLHVLCVCFVQVLRFLLTSKNIPVGVFAMLNCP